MNTITEKPVEITLECRDPQWEWDPSHFYIRMCITLLISQYNNMIRNAMLPRAIPYVTIAIQYKGEKGE